MSGAETVLRQVCLAASLHNLLLLLYGETQGAGSWHCFRGKKTEC